MFNKQGIGPEQIDVLQNGFFASLLNQEFDFYGVDAQQFALGVGLSVVIFEALVNPDDGYRSYLDTIVLNMKSNNVFFKRPIARVILSNIEDDDSDRIGGYQLVDSFDDHLWLRVGTDHTDDYYPYFIFDYRPKPKFPIPGRKQ